MQGVTATKWRAGATDCAVEICFKGIKSIVSIKLTRERPPTTGIWQRLTNTVFTPTLIRMLSPALVTGYRTIYWFRRHPRWQRQPTLLFNGYAEQVASLYLAWICGRISKCVWQQNRWHGESLPASCRIVAVSLAGLGDYHGGLGADPVKDIQHFTGRTDWNFCWRPC